MRRGLLCLLPLLVALLGTRWISMRGALPEAEPVAATSGVSPPALELAGTPGEAANAERQVVEGSLRFEPLPPPPSGLVVQLYAGESDEPVLGAEVFLLERDDCEWYAGRAIDVEALARSQGRKVETDARGRVHLALPPRIAFLCARKGELFGAAQFDADDAPEDELRLVPNHACRVHVTNERGAPLSGIPIVIGERGWVVWRALTGPTGEVLVPNCEWLIAEFVRPGDVWFAGVEEAHEHPALRWFEDSDALPSELEFVLPAATALTLRVQASDGTPVPLRGTIELYVQHGAGNSAAVRFGRGQAPEVMLIAGEARVPRAEPGSWLAAVVEVDGESSFEQTLRVPEVGPAEFELKLPEHSQVLLFRAVDPEGRPLADRELLWSWFGSEDGGLELCEGDDDTLLTDELGRGALVLERRDLEPEELEEGEEPPKPVRWRGVLRLGDGATQLEGPLLDFAALGTSPVRDLGTLRLEPARPLVQGRLLDDQGSPLGFVPLELEHLQQVDGVEQTWNLRGLGEQRSGPDGRFAIHGTCPAGRLRLSVEQDGYELPEGTSAPEFECGSSPELEIRLVRTGILRVSALADARLDTMYTWILDGPGGEKRGLLHVNQGPGEIVEEFWWLQPGRYRLKLVGGNPLEAPIAEFEDVIVRPGERTLDPRLVRVPLHVPAPAPDAPARSEERPPIHITVTDENGRALGPGLLISWGYCSWSRTEFRRGSVQLRAEHAGRQIALWAPGRSLWEGPCPERDASIALAPAPRVRVHIDVPKELRGAFVLLDVLGHDDESALRWLPDMSCSTELDERGDVVLECPGPCRLRVGLRSGETSLETAEALVVEVAAEPLEQRRELAVSAQEWAAFAAALRTPR